MRFGVLGPLAVWKPGGDPVVVPEARVRALLARLLIDPGRVVSADRLVVDLWGDALPANPSGALQTVVSRLRRAIGGGLVAHHPPGYRLNVPLDAVDSGRFTALLGRARREMDPAGRAALLAEALDLWRGDPFAGFADEPFAGSAAAALAEQRLAAWEDYAEARLRLGDHAALAAELRGLVDRNPLRERLRAAHLRALHGAGRTTEALDGYRQLRRLLHDELGLEPAAELAALHQRMLRGEPSTPPSTPPTPLPPPLTELVGRDEAVADLRTLLRTHRLVTLTGPGGVGKTRIALEVARAEHDVCLVELAGLPRETAMDALADVVAAALSIREGSRPRSPADRLVDVLRQRRLLLVLDNCEHVVEAVAALVPRMLRAPDVRVLATSREPLGVSGEHLRELPPLDVPEPGASTADVLRSGAVRLFAARAAAASPGFAVTADNAETVATICRRIDGIPLAIELASARVRVLGTTELAERLHDRFAVLTGGPRDAPPRQRTLRAVLDWSWDLLTAAERAVLRRLAVFADGCTLAAAEAVCSGDDVRSSQVLDLLARLVDRSLVVAAHTADGPRYGMLESVSAYCEQQLDSREHDLLRHAHAAYYTALAEQAAAHLRGPDQQRWLRRLDTESGNLRRALGDDRGAPRLTRALMWYWFLRGRLAEARRATAAAGDTTLAAWHTGFRQLAGEQADSNTALRLHDALTDPRERAMAGWFLGYAATRFGDLPVGETLTRAALAAFEDLGDRWGIAAALTVRALQRHVRGDLGGSMVDAEQSRTLFRETGDRWGQVQAGAVLGRLAEIAGDYSAAAAWHREGVELAEDLALWPDVSMRWSELGRIALLEGDHDRADELHERGRAVAVEHGDLAGQEFAEVGLALSARRRGRYAEAQALLGPWLEWNRTFEADNGAALILAELGFAAEQRGDGDAALKLHTQSLAAARRTGDPRAVALALEGLAGAQLLAGQPRRAKSLLGAAARLRESAGAPLPAGERGDVNRIEAALASSVSTRA
ncbi:BTAD domain-containing putative transcriptional regulator [Phytohabitans aurantiacus]|uniref:SARP family transcriptional regulator n=1 Tax=Phytohabitans aurantiacus TaxID=3016789 RepID=A0ABQ5R0D7_9ACTN|nr:BTAD domain-containing putative transcriptional regulator [Phytohabitans aurantiacus]GLI00272.1 SARP family transcriptional regulator [Phytohabitans aurantiacus]